MEPEFALKIKMWWLSEEEILALVHRNIKSSRSSSITQLEILEKPPVKEDKMLTWPNWPLKLRTSSSHEEGAIETGVCQQRNLKAIQMA